MKSEQTKGMGKHMRSCLAFAELYRGWHSYSRHCRSTKDAIARLTVRGLIETNKYYQFRYLV